MEALDQRFAKPAHFRGRLFLRGRAVPAEYALPMRTHGLVVRIGQEGYMHREVNADIPDGGLPTAEKREVPAVSRAILPWKAREIRSPHPAENTRSRAVLPVP